MKKEKETPNLFGMLDLSRPLPEKDYDDIADIDIYEDAITFDANSGYSFEEDYETILMYYRGDYKLFYIKDVDVIGSYAFANRKKLKEISIDCCVKQILDNAFVNCVNLKSVKFEKDEDMGVIYIGNAAFSGCEALEEIALPETLQSIGSAAFTGCSSLGHIEIPDSVVSIGEAAFLGCTQLSVNKLPKNLKVVERGAFSQVGFVCDLPERVMIIEEYAFEFCYMRSFYIPKSVKYIGRNAFPKIEIYDDEYDDEDGYVLFEGTEEEWNRIEIDNADGWLDGYKVKFNCKRRK